MKMHPTHLQSNIGAKFFMKIDILYFAKIQSEKIFWQIVTPIWYDAIQNPNFSECGGSKVI